MTKGNETQLCQLSSVSGEDMPSSNEIATRDVGAHRLTRPSRSRAEVGHASGPMGGGAYARRQDPARTRPSTSKGLGSRA
jgi:hypothetical protein